MNLADLKGDRITVPRAVFNMTGAVLRMHADMLQGEHRDNCGCTPCEVARELRELNSDLRQLAAKETSSAS